MNSITDDVPCVNTETVGTGEVLQEKKFAEKKMSNEKLVEIVQRTINTDKPIMTAQSLEWLKQCGNFLVFARKHDNKLKLARANFCKNRICNMCNWRRSLKLFSQISEIIGEIANKGIKTRYLFLTLTIRNCIGTELDQTINQLNKAFKALLKTNKGNTHNRLAPQVLGYMKAMEITYNVKDNTYHPHIHCILAVKPGYFNAKNYMKHEDIQTLWQQCLNIDYVPQVNVKAIKSNTPKAIAEVAKYPTKITSVYDVPEGIQEDVLYTMASILKGRRLITFGGLFKDIKAELGLTDVEKETNLVNVGDSDEEGQVIEYVRFTWRAGVYVC